MTASSVLVVLDPSKMRWKEPPWYCGPVEQMMERLWPLVTSGPWGPQNRPPLGALREMLGCTRTTEEGDSLSVGHSFLLVECYRYPHKVRSFKYKNMKITNGLTKQYRESLIKTQKHVFNLITNVINRGGSRVAE